MLNSVDLRANIAVMKILVKLLIQDYLHIPCKKQLMKNTGWWLLQGCLGQFLKIYLITHALHGSWRNCEPKGACLVSACIICTYSCCFSAVNVLANWHVPLSERDYTRPLPINCCHHLNGVSNIWELSEMYIFLSAPYWCNRWPVTDYNQSPWCLWL